MQKVFLYGTLKKGGSLHSFITFYENIRFIENKTIKDFTLYNYMNYYPIAVPEKDMTIDGEVWLLGKAAYKAVKNMELNVGYRECLVEGDIILFIQDIDFVRNVVKATHLGSSWEIEEYKDLICGMKEYRGQPGKVGCAYCTWKGDHTEVGVKKEMKWCPSCLTEGYLVTIE